MSLAGEENGASQTDTSVREVQRAINLDPQNAEFHAALGHLYFREGRNDAAVGELTEALRLDPTNAETAAILGEVAYRRGDIRTAVDWWERALELDPGEALANRKTTVECLIISIDISYPPLCNLTCCYDLYLHWAGIAVDDITARSGNRRCDYIVTKNNITGDDPVGRLGRVVGVIRWHFVGENQIVIGLSFKNYI